MSEIMTKRALEQALKSVLKTKNLKKVTIQDIADECGINRNTFYYHFKDIYDLVEWICIEDGKKALSQYRQYDNWENGTIGLLNMMLENKAFVENVYRNVGRERIESFLFPQIKQVIASIVYEEAEGISVTDEEVRALQETIPELPDEKLERYTEELGIPETDALLLIKYRKVAEYFEKAIEDTQNPKTTANFIIGQIFRTIENESAKEEFAVKVSAESLNELVKMLESKKIKMNLAKSTLDKMLETGKKVSELISESDMGGLDEETTRKLCLEAVEKNPKAVADYKNGKEKAIKSMVGYVMKNSRGKADAMQAENIIRSLIQ